MQRRLARSAHRSNKAAKRKEDYRPKSLHGKPRLILLAHHIKFYGLQVSTDAHWIEQTIESVSRLAPSCPVTCSLAISRSQKTFVMVLIKEKNGSNDEQHALYAEQWADGRIGAGVQFMYNRTKVIHFTSDWGLTSHQKIFLFGLKRSKKCFFTCWHHYLPRALHSTCLQSIECWTEKLPEHDHVAQFNDKWTWNRYIKQSLVRPPCIATL